uniref:Regulatory protein zeste n=1 Tax=Anopheles farauti TaxID=69004 RepID=A0A182QBR9_9DIPT
MEGRMTRVTSLQLKKMATILEAEPQIALALVKGPQHGFWRNLAKELNALGPPEKDAYSWKKAWADYKCTLKKRIVQYNADIDAGQYPKPLNPIHRRIAKLLTLDIKKGRTIVGDGNEHESLDPTDEDAEEMAENTKSSDSAIDAEEQTRGSSAMKSPKIEPAEDYATAANTDSLYKINPYHQRAQRIPTIPIKNHGLTDPLENGTGSNTGDRLDRRRSTSIYANVNKRAKEEHFQKAMEINQALVSVAKTSAAYHKDLVEKLCELNKSNESLIVAQQELSQNVKEMTSALRDLLDVFKTK